MDSALIPEGVKRCPVWQFALWIAANGAVLAWGVFAMVLVFIKGLNQTNMNNAYGFALWIWADLAVIALGGGAFGQQLWRSVKWAGRALDFGAGQERGARSDEASAVEKALERTVSKKAERVTAEDDEAGEEVAADGSGTYEGYAP